MEAWETRLVIRIASNGARGETSPVPCSARPTSLPMTEAFRTVLTTWKISLNDMWFSLAEDCWPYNVRDGEVLCHVGCKTGLDQLIIEHRYQGRIGNGAGSSQKLINFRDSDCFIRFLCLQLLLPPSPL